MSKKSKGVKRLLTWLLAVTLVLTSVPATAFAAESPDGLPAVSDAIVTEQSEAPTEAGGVEADTGDEAEAEAADAAEVDADEENEEAQAPAEETDDADVEDEIIEIDSSEDINKFDASTPMPKPTQEIKPATLSGGQVADGTSYFTVNQAVDGTDIDLYINSSDNPLPKSKGDGTLDEAYWVGIEIPTYEDYTPDITPNNEDIKIVGTNKVYFKVKTDVQYYTINAEYDASRIFTYKVNINHLTISGNNIPNISDVISAEMSTVSLNAAPVSGNYAVATAELSEEYEYDIDVTVDAGSVKRTVLSGNSGYWVSVAVPKYEADGVTAVFKKSYDDSSSYTALDSEKNEKVYTSDHDKKKYQTVLFDMSEADEDGYAYISAVYTWAAAGYSESASFTYRVKLNYTQDNKLNGIDMAKVMEDIKADDVYSTVSTDKVDAYTVTKDAEAKKLTVAPKADKYELNRSKSSGDEYGHYVNIAVSANAPAGVTVKETSGLSANDVKDAEGTDWEGDGYNTFTFNLNDIRENYSTGYIKLIYADGENDKTSETIEVDLSAFLDKLSDGLPSKDSVLSKVEAAPLSGNEATLTKVDEETEEDLTTVNYKLTTASPVVKGVVSGNATSGYYVGIAVSELAQPAVSKNQAGAEAGYTTAYVNKKNDSGDPDPSEYKVGETDSTFKAVIKDGVLSAKASETDAEVDKRVAWFNVAEGKKAYVYVKYANDPATGYTHTYKYIIDLSDVEMSDGLPTAEQAMALKPIVLKDKPAGSPVDPEYEEPYIDNTDGTIEVSFNAAKGITAYTVSRNEATNNGYWVGVGFPSSGNGKQSSASDNKVTGVTYKWGNAADTLAAVDSQGYTTYRKEYVSENGIWYDVFFLDRNATTDKYFKVTYANDGGDKVTYDYHVNLEGVETDNGLPTAEEVAEKGTYLFIGDKVSENKVADPYSIGDVKVSGNTITVSVNAPNGIKAYNNGFWAGVKVKAVSDNYATKEKLGYKVKTSLTNGADYVANTKSDNLYAKDFNIDDGGANKIYVKYTSDTMLGDNAVEQSVIYTYELDFTGVKKDMSPDVAALKSAIKPATLSENGLSQNYIPYTGNYTAVAGTEVTEDDSVTIPVKLTTRDLRLYTEKAISEKGMGYWVGVAIPQSLSENATEVKYYHGSDDPTAVGDSAYVAFNASGYHDASETKDDVLYDTFFFDANDFVDDDKAYVALRLKESNSYFYVIYELDFSGVELKKAVYDVTLEATTNKQKLFATGTAPEVEIPLKATVKKDGVSQNNIPVEFVLGGSKNVGNVFEIAAGAGNKTSGSGADTGTAAATLKVKENPSQNAVATVTVKVAGYRDGDTKGAASYSVETYTGKTGDAARKVDLELPDAGYASLTPHFELADGSSYKTAFSIKENDDVIGDIDQWYGIEGLKNGSATISQNIVDNEGKPVNVYGENAATYLSVDYPVTVKTPLAGVTLDSETARTQTIYANNAYDDALTLSFSPSTFELSNSASVSWSSSNEAVATVAEGTTKADGTITTLAAGRTTITAAVTQDGVTRKASFVITVEPKIESIEIYQGTKEVTETITVDELNKEISLKAVTDPAGVAVTWSSSNADVAAVDKNGTVTTKGVGSANIKATAEDGSFDTVSFTVTQKKSIQVTASPEAVNLEKKGSTATITPAFTVNNASIAVEKANIKAESSDEKIATVTVSDNKTVTVTAVADKGTANVTITYTADGKDYNSSSATVNVGKAPVKITGLTSEPAHGSSITLYYDGDGTYNEEMDFTYSVSPKNYTDTTFKWESSFPSVATVDPVTGHVKAVGSGWTEIKLTAQTAGEEPITCYIQVTVKKRPYVESIAIEPKTLTLKAPLPGQKTGESAKLTAKASPASAKDAGNIAWKSSNESVVTVNKATGLVTAVGAGTATVFAKSTYANQSIKVTVTDTINTDDYYDGYRAGEAWIGKIADENGDTYVYDGTAIKPEPNVYYDDVLLVKGTDYTLSYKNNINATVTTKAQVIATLKGNYSGKITKEFTIEQRDINDAQANNASALAVVNAKSASGYKEQLLKPVVTYNNKTLRAGTDYEPYWTDTEDGAYEKPGMYSVKLVGLGNYKGVNDDVQEILVDKASGVNLSKAKVELTFDPAVKNAKGAVVANQAYYTGEAIEPADIKVTYQANRTAAVQKLTRDTDYSVTVTNNVNLGTATVTLTGMGVDEDGVRFFGQKKQTFKIVPDVVYLDNLNEGKLVITVNDTVVEAKSSPNAKGKSETAVDATNIVKIPYAKGGAKPSSVAVSYVKDALEADLKAGTDYTWTNKFDAKTMTGTVTITGKGKFYKNKATVAYKVTKQNIEEMTFVVDDYLAKNAAAVAKYAAKPEALIKVYDLDGKALTFGKPNRTGALPASADYKLEIVDGPDSPVIGDEVQVKITAVEANDKYEGESYVTYRIVDDSTIKTLKKAKYAFLKDGKEESAAKFGVKYAGTPVVLDKDSLVIRAYVKVGRSYHYEVLDDSDYEIVNYTNNNKVGTSKITIRGTGDYAGLLTLSFKIKK